VSNRWLFKRSSTGRLWVCQISGPWDGERGTRLPAQCCGLPADQIWKCEQIAAPGHRCQVNDHTILHERMGNGYGCSAVEQWLAERDGLSGWIRGQSTRFTAVGAR
jgi:hypothetical protein